MEYMAVLTAAPTVWSRSVFMTVLRTLSLGSTSDGAGTESRALSSPAPAALMASVVGAGWVAGKVSSRYCCLRLGVLAFC